jgi:large subunit ribosomal protein L22
VTGPKTNERNGTRAQLRYARISPYKVREVLDIIRNKPVDEARNILRFSERDAAIAVGKLLDSAIANAQNNDGLDPEELFVATAYCDEGTTMKRWRPRARGRATRLRKRTSHVPIIVGRLPDEQLVRLRAKRSAEAAAQRSRRVSGSRGRLGRRRRDAEDAAVVATEEELGIVDETGPAVVEAEEMVAEAEEEAFEEAQAEEAATPEPEVAPAEEIAAAAEAQGIVDPQAAAVADAESETESETESEKEEGE